MILRLDDYEASGREILYERREAGRDEIYGRKTEFQCVLKRDEISTVGGLGKISIYLQR